MTRYEKSDSQLDAEVVRRPIGERLTAHRLAYRHDCVVPRMVSRQPPLTRYEKSDDPGLIRYGANEEYVIERGTQLGMPMSGNILRRLSENPGALYPWVTAFGWLRRECRKHHYSHRSGDRPFWRGALCWEAVRLTVIGGEKARAFTGPLSLVEAGRLLRLDHLEALLHNAFDDIEGEMRFIERRAEKRMREDSGLGPGPLPVYRHAERHDQGGLHSQECPACRRGAA